jgi:hypothetical protein
VIAAAAAAAAVATPSREALVRRWLHANRAHSAASLHSPGRTPPSPPNLQALAQRELNSPRRYKLTETPAPPVRESPWRRFLTWLGDRWDQLWRSLSKRVHFSERTANGIGWTLLAVVSFILLWVAVRLLVNLQLVRSRKRLDAQPLEAPLDSQALYQKAREAASRGEYGRAAVLLFAATVAVLDLRGAVSGNRSATVGDLRRELRSTDASLVALFDAIAGPFVQAAYAERAVDATQWERAERGYSRLSEPS